MAGYSGKPLAAKLGLKPGVRLALVEPPERFLEELHPKPEATQVVEGKDAESAVDIVVLFAEDSAVLAREFEPWAARIRDSGMLWVAWPKKASRVPTDLTEDRVRDRGLAVGLVDVKVCAINEVWSGLKFVRRLRDRAGA